MNWKGQALDAAVRWVLPILCALATTVLAFRLIPGEKLHGLWARLGIPLYLVSRVGGILLLYYLAGYQGSGDFQYWLDWARRVLDGEVPTRDFVSPYGPLYHHAQALGLALLPGGHGVGVLLPFLIGDALLVFCTAALARDLVGPEGEATVGLWLVLEPFLWSFLLVGGQDEALFAGILAASALAAHRGRWPLAMAVLALGACLTKASYGPYAFAILAVAYVLGGRARWSIGVFFAVLILCSLPLVLVGWDPLAFTRYASSGVWWRNLSWIAWEAAPGAGRIAAGATYAIAVVAATVWAVRRRAIDGEARRLVLAVVVVHAASMLSLPFALTEYTTQGLPFLLVFLLLPTESRFATWLLRLLPACLLTILLLRGTAFRPGIPTGESAYAMISVPLFLALHAAILWLVYRRTKSVSAPRSNDGAGLEGALS